MVDGYYYLLFNQFGTKVDYINRCHVNNDPDHELYLCKKPCGRTKADCKEDHKCGKKCHEDCDRCREKVNRTLPCGHSVFAECGLDDENIQCR